MLNRTADATVTMENLAPGSTHSYIVQPISFVEIADNASSEYRVTTTCLQASDPVYETEGPILLASTGGVETAAASGPALDDSIVVLIAGILAAAAAVMIVTLLAVKKRR